MLLGDGGPGSANFTSSKSKVVADLDNDYKQLNKTLGETDSLTKKIGQNMRNGRPAFGGKSSGPGNIMANEPAATSMDLPSSPNTGTYKGGKTTPGEGGYVDQASQGYGRTAMAYSGLRAYEAIRGEEYLYNDVATRRFGFFAGQQGRALGSQNARALNERGFAISSTDAIEAQLAGTSSGIMPGMQRTSGIFNTVTGISNLTGQGLAASMAATSNLHTGQTVNKLRMIGVKVRSDDGYARGIEDIARDLWKLINKTKTGRGKITKKDLDFSLLPGNSLDMLLNQYFGNDAVLRQAIQAALYQMASGGDFSKESLEATGAMAGSAKSVAERQASIYANRDQLTDAGVAGQVGANVALKYANQGIEAVRGLPIIKNIVDVITGAITFGQTFFGAGMSGGENIGMSQASNMFGYGGSGRGIGDGEVGLSKSMSSPLDNGLHVNSEFNTVRTVKGKKTSPHKGIDFRASQGATIRAVKGGRVTANGKNATLGNYVSVTHSDGYITTYAHMKARSNASGYVEAGDPIGLVGQTGFADGPHLHLAVQDENGKYYNPRDYLSGKIGSKDTSGNSDTVQEATGKQLISLFKGAENKTSLFAKYKGDGDVPVNSSGSGSRYGSVTVHINLPAGSAMDERKLALEVKRILQDEEQMRRTVTR